MWRWQCTHAKSHQTETCYAQSTMALAWSIGEWGTCSNNMQYRTINCVEWLSGKIVDTSYCTSEAPESSRACSEVNNLHIQSSHYADALDAANLLADLHIIPNFS